MRTSRSLPAAARGLLLTLLLGLWPVGLPAASHHHARRIEGTVIAVDPAHRLLSVRESSGQTFSAAWSQRTEIFAGLRPAALDRVRPGAHVAVTYATPLIGVRQVRKIELLR